MSNLRVWSSELTSKQISNISCIENDIKAEQNNIANGFIRLGGLLAKAKQEFKDPADFNAWASERTTFAPRTIQALIQIYSKFGGDPTLRNLPKGTLQELLRAPESLLEQVKEEVAATGETVGAKKMRERVVEAKKREEPIEAVCEEHAKVGKPDHETEEDADAMAELAAMRNSSASFRLKMDGGKVEAAIAVGADETIYRTFKPGPDLAADICVTICEAIEDWTARLA